MSNETYSRAPFVAYDGIDEDGVRAEVHVVTGYGDVQTIKESDNKKRDAKEFGQNVIFKVSNNKWPISGWSKNTDKVMEKIQKAYDEEIPIHFRIEIRRKPEVDRTLPIAPLVKGSENAKENAFRSLAAVRFDDEEEWTVSKNAVTRLDEDPSNNAPGLISANDYSLEELQAALPGAKQSGAAASAPQDWSDKVEAPPWITWLNQDEGKLNLGSNAVALPITFFIYVTEFEREHQLELNDKQRKILSRALLSAANEIQVNGFDGIRSKPDMSQSSHVRARSIVFETVRTYHPITEDVLSSAENLKAWRNNIVETGTDLFEWSIQETKRFLK